MVSIPGQIGIIRFWREDLCIEYKDGKDVDHMCGIAGIIGHENDRSISRKLLDTMKHRGPDGEGIYESGLCTLLHARLSVIDPDGGAQPMILEWEGERYILIYNGELYNTLEIRKELESLGHSFLGHSDTEVVIHAYAHWKKGCIDRFNGIFAFAVWEERKRSLFLARDRIGVKPMFFMEHGGGLVFASEM